MIVGLLGLVLYAGPLSANGMQAYFADFTNPALLSDVDSASAAVTVPPAYVACASQPPNVVFGVNFTSGLAYRDGILYGLEWENGNGPAIFLYRFAADNCATGTRVGGATGHANLESLAYCEADGFFYSVDFAFEAPPRLYHRRLGRIAVGDLLEVVGPVLRFLLGHGLAGNLGPHLAGALLLLCQRRDGPLLHPDGSCVVQHRAC